MMDNKEFDAFVRKAAEEELEAAPFLDWEHMNIPVKKKRRFVPLWFALFGLVLYIGLLLGVKNDQALTHRSTLNGESAALPAEACDDSARDVSFWRKAISAWSIAQRAQSADLESKPLNDQSVHAPSSAPAVPATGSFKLGSNDQSQGTKRNARTEIAEAEAHLIDPVEDAVQVEVAPLRGNLTPMTPKQLSYSFEAPSLQGTPLVLSAINAPLTQVFRFAIGTNSYRNILSTTGETSSAFGRASVGQSVALAVIRPIKGKFSWMIGATYHGLNFYYEDVKDLGFANDFEAGLRIRRLRVIRHNNRLELLRMDAGLHKAFGFGPRWTGFACAQLSPGFLLRSSGRLLVDDQPGALVLEAPRQVLTPLLSTSLVIGTSYALTEQFGLLLETSFTQHLSAFQLSKALDQSIKPQVIDLRLGVEMKLYRAPKTERL